MDLSCGATVSGWGSNDVQDKPLGFASQIQAVLIGSVKANSKIMG